MLFSSTGVILWKKYGNKLDAECLRTRSWEYLDRRWKNDKRMEKIM